MRVAKYYEDESRDSTRITDLDDAGPYVRVVRIWKFAWALTLIDGYYLYDSDTVYGRRVAAERRARRMLHKHKGFHDYDETFTVR